MQPSCTIASRLPVPWAWRSDEAQFLSLVLFGHLATPTINVDLPSSSLGPDMGICILVGCLKLLEI